MSCCDTGSRGDEPPTVRHLIHDLSSYWVDQAKPVHVGLCCSGCGEYNERRVTGVTTSASGQVLDVEPFT